MSLRTIFGFLSPKLLYSEESLPVDELPLSKKAILLYEGKGELALKTGDQVQGGQNILPDLCSTVTGKVTGITNLQWLQGKTYTAIEIETSEDQWDSSISGITDYKSKSSDELIEKLRKCGVKLNGISNGYDTVVVNGVDSDLLICTSGQVLKDSEDNLKAGIELIKQITGANKAVIAVTSKNQSIAEGIAKGIAEVSVIKPNYPQGAPGILARTTGSGRTYVIRAEILSAMTQCITSGKPVIEKMVTVINKNNKPVKNLKVRIGTPVSEILQSLSISLNKNEKLILGGPMTGMASYSENFPITAEIDAVLIQDAGEVNAVENSPCIGCGKCVEICPQKLQINMISRFSEFSIFEKCEDFDIDYCIECGMCAYVCTSRRPLVQFVQFAKNELKKMKEKEQELEKKEEE